MKAILLAPTYPPTGGIAGWTVRMLNAKLRAGWSFEVVDERTIGKRQVFGKEGKRNYLVEVQRCFRIWKDLQNKLKDPEVKVVHSCIPSVTFAMLREYVCAHITKMSGRKFIIHFRCTVPNTTQGIIGHRVLKMLCNKSDLILSLNNQTSEYLSHITSTPIQLIPNFISEDEISSDYEVREAIKTVIYVGGLVENKGIYDCLDVARQLPSIQFRFVGKGNFEFEERAKNLGLNNVVFVGAKDRAGVKEELRNADVFLFLTYFRGEGFSNALCEAMATGLPCIVSDWAANRDMIGNTGGIVVDIHDVDGVVNAFECIRARESRLRMSIANVNKVKSEYVEGKVVEQYIDAYERVITRG